MSDRPSKEQVLAWMADQHKGPTEASRHFSIPVGTIKRWHHEEGGNKLVRGKGSRVSAGPKLTEPAHGSSTIPSPRGDRTAAALPPNDRARLRGSVRRMLEFLDSDDATKDPKKAADAARTLDILLARCPDIMTFEDRTHDLAGNGSDRLESDTRRLHEALHAGRSQDPGESPAGTIPIRPRSVS